MAKKLNQTKISNAKLVVANIESYGKHYAFEYGGADGLSIINVDPIPAPTDIKAYLEGNLTLTSYPVSNNISKLCAYALASFPNLESIYLFKNDDLVELEQDAFFGLDNLDSVYVPDFLYDGYVATYPAYEDLFKKIISTMDLVVPTFTGVTKLTKEIFTQVVGMLESAKKNAIERVVVPAQYTELGTECFEAISQLSICDTIVLEAVTSAEADFMKGNSSISYIQIENANFSLQGVADTTGTANFKWLTPLAYMHDYIYQDYVKDYYITGYAGITNGQAMPSREEYGYWKWYSSPATTDDTYLGDSETYPTATYTGKAYAFLIIDTLKIVGTGTLTAEMITNAINSIDTEISPLNLIERIIVPTAFTDYNQAFVYDYSQLPNLNTAIINNIKYDTSEFIVGYIRLDYARSDGSQVINTNKKPYYFETKLTINTFANYIAILGYDLRIGGGSGYAFVEQQSDSSGYKLRQYGIGDGSSIYFNIGEKIHLTKRTIQYNQNATFILFSKILTIPNNVQMGASLLKLWDNNDNLILHYVPVKNMQGICGFYDLVNNEFVRSQGSSDFIAGNVYYPSQEPVVYNQKIPNNLIELDTQTSQVPSSNLMGSYVSIINPIPVGHKVYAKITTDDPKLRLVWYKNGTSGYDFATGELVNASSQPSNAVEGIYEITSDMIYSDGYLQLYYYVFAGLPTGQHHITIQLVDLTALGMDNIISVPIFKATELGKQLDIANLPYKD